MRRLKHSFRPLPMRLFFHLAILLALVFALSCKHRGPVMGGETMYVSAPQASLRDHVAAVYNRVGTVKNGDRVEVLERQKRFVRVRTAQKVEGWIELRALVPEETFEQFQRLAKDNHNTPVVAHGATRVELNMHVTPGRETETLYQLPENTKVEMLKRASTERATPEEIAAKRRAFLAKAVGESVKPKPKRKPVPRPAPVQAPALNPVSQEAPAAIQPLPQSADQPPAMPSSNSAPPQEPQPKPMDDWWLVRDQQGHVGWVLGRMVDIDIPLNVAQYAEGQRIQGAFVLNTVQDEEKGAIQQYLVLLNANKDGVPYDFNQIRVFVWNLKKHRYETSYRERYIMGYFPAKVSTEDFGREGWMPVFTIRKQNVDGSITERKYRLIGNVVRQVLAPGEQLPQAAHSPDEPKKDTSGEKNSAPGKASPHRKNQR